MHIFKQSYSHACFCAQVKDRFVDRRSTKRGLPVLYKLRRRCFKKLLDESRLRSVALTLSCLTVMVKTDGFVAGDDDDEEDAGDDKVKVELVLKEFRGRWQALLAGQVRVCL